MKSTKKAESVREIGNHRIASAHGNLVPGTWQQIFHLECDVRARERTVVVTVIGDERQSIWN
jgi:thiamine phosphate synthase YjbQ (UPF0047 family)